MIMREKIFASRFVFKTKNNTTFIDDAMLAAFPNSEWNEVRNCSTFESKSLFKAIAERLFENADDVLASAKSPLFDVLSEHEVVLTFCSVHPIESQITPLHELLTYEYYIELNE